MSVWISLFYAGFNKRRLEKKENKSLLKLKNTGKQCICKQGKSGNYFNGGCTKHPNQSCKYPSFQKERHSFTNIFLHWLPVQYCTKCKVSDWFNDETQVEIRVIGKHSCSVRYWRERLEKDQQFYHVKPVYYRDAALPKYSFTSAIFLTGSKIRVKIVGELWAWIEEHEKWWWGCKYENWGREWVEKLIEQKPLCDLYIWFSCKMGTC